ncbi:MAG: GNAT family N-acetyltransferase [Persicimonas sp.]
MADLGETIRPATKRDAATLARLVDLAGEGLPSWLWARSAQDGEDAFEVGQRRAVREEGGFSYRNAHVIEVDGQVAGMLLGYRLPEPYEVGDLSELPEVVRPLVELEAQAPGTWYVNAVAVFEAFRGRGLGTQLMDLAEQLARDSGADELSLIVAENNDGARRLYERLGYEVRAGRPGSSADGFSHEGDWVLMTKPSVE